MTAKFNPYDFQAYQSAADYLRSKIDFEVEVGIILGSALGGLCERVSEAITIPYREVPQMLSTTNPAHKGEFVFGRLGGKNVALLSGRFHSYEGYNFPELAQPVRILKLLGAKTLIVSNAAGGVNPDFEPGDLMLITDQIKLSGASPLAGPNLEEFGTRFPDVSFLYTPKLLELAREAAKDLEFSLQEGVYFFMAGPQYETPAEIRAISLLGGDAVGMSTVTETIVAAHCGMEVLGISLITNKAAGLSSEALSDDEVIEVGNKSGKIFQDLVERCLEKME
ncbi:MAG: purine-nucleoside phosphorylase [Eubacteriales bacterium]|nr:purine-nucleoside phosphorylase [Eubacteriales bacterium]